MKRLCSFSTLAALILFFLPWLDVKCSGQSIMTQSGTQAAYGGMTPAEGTEEMNNESEGDGLGTAWFVGLAFLLTVAALFASVTTLDDSSKTPGVLAGSALGLVLIQMVAGFPLEKKIAEGSKQMEAFGGLMKSASTNQNSDDPSDVFAAQALSSMDMGAKTEYMPPLYFTLVALAVAAFSGIVTTASDSRSEEEAYFAPESQGGYPAASAASSPFPQSDEPSPAPAAASDGPPEARLPDLPPPLQVKQDPVPGTSPLPSVANQGASTFGATPSSVAPADTLSAPAPSSQPAAGVDSSSTGQVAAPPASPFDAIPPAPGNPQSRIQPFVAGKEDTPPSMETFGRQA